MLAKQFQPSKKVKSQLFTTESIPTFSPAENNSQIDDIKKYFSINGDYLLYVGNMKPHKNIINIIKSFTLLKKVKNLNINLVLTGEKERLITSIKDIQIEKDINNHIIFTGFVSNKILLSLYPEQRFFYTPLFVKDLGFLCWRQWHVGFPS